MHGVCAFWILLPALRASLKDAPPFSSRLPNPLTPRGGAEFPGPADTVTTATRPYWPQPTWGLHLRRCGLVAKAEHGQSLRGGSGGLPGEGVPQQEGTWRHPYSYEKLLDCGVGEGSSLETLWSWRPFGREPFPCPLPALEMTAVRAPFPGLWELHFPGAISVSAHFP